MPIPPQRNLPIAPGGVAAEMGTMDPRRARKTVRPATAVLTDEPMTEDEFRKRLTPRPLPGRRGKGTGKIRWCHQVVVEGRTAICHSFTVPRAVHDAVRAGEPLSHEGVTRPNGQPVVPKGADPTNYAVRCASCGSEQVSCREMVFLEE